MILSYYISLVPMEARSWSGVSWSEGSPDQKLQDLHYKLVNLKDDMTKLNEESGGQLLFVSSSYMSLIMRKPAFCICENKDADQLRGNREAVQHFCFCYTDSTIPVLLKSKISSLKPSSVAVQPRRLVFSEPG